MTLDATRKIKVLIVDDHMMVRDVLIALLRALDEFEVVGSTSDARSVLTLCANARPDVVLMDLLMPYMDGVTVTQILQDRFPHIKVVILTGSAVEPLIVEALKAGATSYILKTGSIQELAHAIRSAYHGNSILAPEVIDILLSAIHRPESASQIGEKLTWREREVLALVVDGLPNGKIAAHLLISTSTVKSHIHSIYSKLGTHSRTAVVALALKYQLHTKA